MTFEELYHNLLEKTLEEDEIPKSIPQADPNHLDSLLNPKKYAPVWAVKNCTECGDGPAECCTACLFNAIHRDDDGKIIINPDLCSGCASCLKACKSGVLTASRDILPTLHAVKHAKGPVYALVAPSFHGQYSNDVTPGKLRSAFLELGFTEMIEVALFADILTFKEALAFEHHVNSSTDYQLTSCCCPVWISMVQKASDDLVSHIPGYVSPMIAAGRTIKALHPDALTVFIGPCLAKKAEARYSELKGAVDWVLTYKEIKDIFEAADIHPKYLEDNPREHASRTGRIYGRAGGVSEAVQDLITRLYPNRTIPIEVYNADGVLACKELIKKIQSGSTTENYYEGMGCVGGCVGGPQVIIDKEVGRKNVDFYGNQAEFESPLNNPYVTSLLEKLGYETVEDFLKKSDLYDRVL